MKVLLAGLVLLQIAYGRFLQDEFDEFVESYVSEDEEVE